MLKSLLFIYTKCMFAMLRAHEVYNITPSFLFKDFAANHILFAGA